MKYIKKIIMILVVIGMLFILTGCTNNSVAEEEKRFQRISNEGNFYVVYDKKTKVMYSVSNSYYNFGIMTLLVNSEGKPLLYEGGK